MGAACGRSYSLAVDDPSSRCVPCTPDLELEEIVNGLEVRSVESSAECPVCLDALCKHSSCAVLMMATRRSMRRACAHLFHETCIHSLDRSASAGRCPICRAAYDSVKQVPRPTEDPHGWFNCVDAEEDGRLSKKQVTDALLAAFPINCDKFEAALPQLWERWDLNGSGYINKQEFMARGALYDFASTLHRLCIAESESSTRSPLAAPASEVAPAEVAPAVELEQSGWPELVEEITEEEEEQEMQEESFPGSVSSLRGAMVIEPRRSWVFGEREAEVGEGEVSELMQQIMLGSR